MSKDIEVEDLRTRVKELEDQLNEKTVELEKAAKTLKSFEYEYQWLAGQYQAILGEIHDKIDELNYNIKHSNLKEVIDNRNAEIKAAKEQKAQEMISKAPPIPKGVDKEDAILK